MNNMMKIMRESLEFYFFQLFKNIWIILSLFIGWEIFLLTLISVYLGSGQKGSLIGHYNDGGKQKLFGSLIAIAGFLLLILISQCVPYSPTFNDMTIPIEYWIIFNFIFGFIATNKPNYKYFKEGYNDFFSQTFKKIEVRFENILIPNKNRPNYNEDHNAAAYALGVECATNDLIKLCRWEEICNPDIKTDDDIWTNNYKTMQRDIFPYWKEKIDLVTPDEYFSSNYSSSLKKMRILMDTKQHTRLINLIAMEINGIPMINFIRDDDSISSTAIKKYLKQR